MNLFLDTCVLLWLTVQPRKLSALARNAIDDEENNLYVSHATVSEIALKSAAGKLDLPMPLRSWLDYQHREWGFEYVKIGLEHLLRTAELHRHHADPFDRLLIAQAICDGFAIVTPDIEIAKYPVHVVW